MIGTVGNNLTIGH